MIGDLMNEAETDALTAEHSEMESGRLLIRNGRAWLTLTAEDVERGALAVVLDPHYRAEIGRSALSHASEVGDAALYAAISDEWARLDYRDGGERHCRSCAASREAQQSDGTGAAMSTDGEGRA